MADETLKRYILNYQPEGDEYIQTTKNPNSKNKIKGAIIIWLKTKIFIKLKKQKMTNFIRSLKTKGGVACV